MEHTSTIEEKQNRQVSDYWVWVAKRLELGFWNIPGWVEHQNLLGFNDPSSSWLHVFNKELLDKGVPPGHALSLGCGGGSLERTMRKEGFCQCIEGCDISPGMVKIAEEAAKNEGIEGITYYLTDLNNPNFAAKKYDLIIGAGIFHHVENLEGLFENLAQALTPRGKLLMYDYVGPSRFQWTQPQIERCNMWLERLPARLKRKRGYPFYYYVAKQLFDLIPFSYSAKLENWIKEKLPARLVVQFLRLKTAQLKLEKIIPPHPDQFLVTDPSEAVRSEEVMPILERYFSIERLVPQGGTLAAPLFGRTVANFLRDAEGKKWAQQILEDEREAIQQGALSSDLIALVARPR
jgi:SAM-dependent methyltransferase